MGDRGFYLRVEIRVEEVSVHFSVISVRIRYPNLSSQLFFKIRMRETLPKELLQTQSGQVQENMKGSWREERMKLRQHTAGITVELLQPLRQIAMTIP